MFQFPWLRPPPRPPPTAPPESDAVPDEEPPAPMASRRARARAISALGARTGRVSLPRGPRDWELTPVTRRHAAALSSSTGSLLLLPGRRHRTCASAARGRLGSAPEPHRCFFAVQASALPEVYAPDPSLSWASAGLASSSLPALLR